MSYFNPDVILPFLQPKNPAPSVFYLVSRNGSFGGCFFFNEETTKVLLYHVALVDIGTASWPETFHNGILNGFPDSICLVEHAYRVDWLCYQYTAEEKLSDSKWTMRKPDQPRAVLSDAGSIGPLSETISTAILSGTRGRQSRHSDWLPRSPTTILPQASYLVQRLKQIY